MYVCMYVCVCVYIYIYIYIFCIYSNMMAPHMAASVCCSLVLFLFLFVCPVLSNDFPISFTRNELLDIRNSTPDNLLPTFEHSDVLLDILVGGAAFLFKRSRRRKRGKRAGLLVNPDSAA